jgi:hypothetical protein
MTWTASASGNGIISTSCYSVASNGSLWVAAGDKLAYSNDGTTWTVASGTTPTTSYAVAWNGNIWIAGGIGTIMVYSTNGVNWYPINSVFDTMCQAVATRRVMITRGTKIFNGVGLPPSTGFNKGDIWLDTSTGFLYVFR